MQLKNPFKNAKLYKYPYGDILQIFGVSPEIYGRIGLKGHNGIDFYQPYGTPVLAVCDAQIIEIKFSPEGYGRHIRIMSKWEGDTAYEITYGHLSLIADWLKIGDWVNAGDVIGYCGNSGFVVSGGVSAWGESNPDKKGTHLHFGIREFSKQDTGWQTEYSTGKYYVKNYENWFKGAIDPNEFFREEINKQAISVIEIIKKILENIRLSLKK